MKGYQHWKRDQLKTRVDALFLFMNTCHDPDDGKFCGDEAEGYIPAAEVKILAGVEDAGVRARVGELFADRRATEPQMTKIVEDVSHEFGGEPIGLAFRLKKASGVVEKVDRKVREKGISPEAAAEGISDALRYTMGFPPERYVDGTRAALKKLSESGFEVLEVENNWAKGDAYNGVNAVVRDPRTGLKVEVQFHTPQSWDIKDVQIHKDYEFVREHRGTSAQRLLAHERMRAKSDSAEFPAGVDDLCSGVENCKDVYRPNKETLFTGVRWTV